MTHMSVETGYAHIEQTPGVCGGKRRIQGTRIRVLDIVALFESNGLSPDEICDQYPGLTLGMVYSALAYYFDHRNELEAEIAAEREKVERFRRDHPNQVAS
jgi:uncharacterized protein (DUF433 family)